MEDRTITRTLGVCSSGVPAGCPCLKPGGADGSARELSWMVVGVVVVGSAREPSWLITRESS